MELSSRRNRLILFCLLVLVSTVDGQDINTQLAPAKLGGDGQLKRSVLTARQLLDGTDLPSPVDDTSAFQPPLQAAEPDAVFEGTLSLKAARPGSHFNLLSDVFKLVPQSDSPWKHLPPFHFQFVQHGSFFIPVAQGLLVTGDPAWNYIVGVGRIWREQGDEGYMRASLPFALVQRNQNCTHNGTMSFLLSPTKRPRISSVYYQITQETCYPMKFDMWGMLDAELTPERLSSATEVRQNFAAEQSRRMPIKPLAALAEDFPGKGIDLAAIRNGYKHPEELTTYGFVFHGVHYSAGCPTRSGEYAFCDEMRLPSYSIAKSVFAGVALMRLGQLYGTDVYNLRIKDFISPKPGEGNWEHTTFGNTSDMATGNFNSDAYEADEDSPVNDRFLIDESLEAKIRDAFAFHKNYAMPGTVWVYQSAATFLLTQSMNKYLREKKGLDADLFRQLQTDVYEPLGMSRGFMTTIRTENSPNGAPAGYYGLFFNKDDVAKIGNFLDNSDGKIRGDQVLDPARLAEALFRAPSIDQASVEIVGFSQHSALGGAPANQDSASKSRRYAHGFWGRRITHDEFPEFKCEFWVSLMNGYGGNTVILMPNGAIYYAFSDGFEYPWGPPLSLSAKIAPLCN